MKVKALFEQRASVRQYKNEKVPKEVILDLADAAKLAPSAVNLQPWKIYIVEKKSVREKINKAYPKEWFRKAPEVAIFCGLKNENWVRNDGRSYLMCDVTILADYFVLAATEAGLGTCYIAAFDENIVKDALGLKQEEPILIVTFGYPDENTNKKEKKRKRVDEIIQWV